MLESFKDIPTAGPPTLSLETRSALGIPENEHNNELIHKAIIKRMLIWDLIDTLELEGKEVKPGSIPPVIYKAIQGGDIKIPKNEEERESLKFPSSSKEALEITHYSLHNKEVFKKKASETDNSDEKEKYDIMAKEAGLLHAILVDDFLIRTPLNRGLDEGWNGNKIELQGLSLSLLRSQYINGNVKNLNGYTAYKEAVEGSDLSKMAQLTVESYDQLKAFGLSSFRELFDFFGLDKGSVEGWVNQAVNFFKQGDNQSVLENKIDELVTEGVIPKKHKRTFAASVKAARLLDREAGIEPLTPRQLFEEIAEKEAIEHDPDSVLFLEEEETAGSLPWTLIVGFIGPSGENVIAAINQFPKGTPSEHIAHELGHIVQAVVIGSESPFLATKLPIRRAERIATFIEYKYSGEATHYQRLFSLRCALLTEAQLAHIPELDAACKAHDQEKINSILKDSLTKPTKKMKKTFGKAVAGETYGYPFGALGLNGHPRAFREGDQLKSLAQIIEEAITIT